MRESDARRGFQDVYHDGYNTDSQRGEHRLVGESSAIDIYYEYAFDRPGSSFLWIGEKHHLNREEVAQLRDYLSHWLEGERLFK